MSGCLALEFDLSLKILLSACCVAALGVLPARGADAPSPAQPPAAQSAVPSAEAAPLSPANVELLRRALDQAEAQGLKAKAFVPPKLDELLASQDADARRR